MGSHFIKEGDQPSIIYMDPLEGKRNGKVSDRPRPRAAEDL